MRSIRKQLTRQILIGTFALLLVAGAAFCFVIRARLVDEFDRTLTTKAGAFVALTTRDGHKLDIESSDESMPEFVHGDAPEYFEFFLPDAMAIRRSPTLAGADLPLDARHVDKPLFRNLRLPDGRAGRLVQIAFAPRVEEPDPEDAGKAPAPLDEDEFMLPAAMDAETVRLVLVIARGRDDLDALLGSIYLTLGALVVLLVGGIALLVRRAVRRGFQPLDAMNAQLKKIGPETLESRVQLTLPPEELDTMHATLNGLLDRLETGFARERRFSSDVAHELRTPVAELCAACDVGAKWPDDPVAVRGFFEDVREIALQMERVVANLLVLARCDNGTTIVRRERVPARLLVDECWQRAAVEALERGLRFRNQIDPSLTLQTDPDQLAMIWQNLVDNAVAYSLPESAIEVESAAANGGIDLILRNHTANLATEDLAHVFNRFWQKDRARSDQNRSGLGLSIAKALSDLLGLRLSVDLQVGPVFEVRLSFPAEFVEERDLRSRPDLREAVTHETPLVSATPR